MIPGPADGSRAPAAAAIGGWRTGLVCVGLSAYLLGIFVNVVGDPDLWGSLAFGRLLCGGGRFPYHDVFSYVPTKAVWVNHEWLAAVLFFVVHEHLGAVGLQLLRYLTIFMTLGLIAATALRRGARAAPVLIAVFFTASAVTAGYSPVRAQVFTYLLFALSLLILETFRTRGAPGPLWWLVPVHIVWCNLHGGFVAGLGLIALYAVAEGLGGRAFLPYVRVLLCSAAATLVNPYGVRCWAHVVRAVTMRRPGMFEWMSIPEAVRAGIYSGPLVLFGALLGLSLLLLVRYRRRDWTDVLVLAVTAGLGFAHVRHSILFVLAFGALLPLALGDLLDNLEHHVARLDRGPIVKRTARAAVLLLFVAVCGASFSRFVAGPSLDIRAPGPEYPVGAIEWIKARHWEGNVLPDFDWGEYVIWSCSPNCRVAMDGRLETVYPSAVSEEYAEFLNGRAGWTAFLERYPHDMVLIKSWTRAAALMKGRPEWRTVYEDVSCAVFLRRAVGTE